MKRCTKAGEAKRVVVVVARRNSLVVEGRASCSCVSCAARVCVLPRPSLGGGRIRRCVVIVVICGGAVASLVCKHAWQGGRW